MPKKPGLSRDQHTELGEELAAMRDRLGRITFLLSGAYPQPIADAAHRAQTDIDKLRSVLDDKVFEEYPDLTTKGNAGIYYPKRPATE